MERGGSGWRPLLSQFWAVNGPAPIDGSEYWRLTGNRYASVTGIATTAITPANVDGSDQQTSIGMGGRPHTGSTVRIHWVRRIGENQWIPEGSCIVLTVNPTEYLDSPQTPFDLEHALLILGRKILVNYSQADRTLLEE